MKVCARSYDGDTYGDDIIRVDYVVVGGWLIRKAYHRQNNAFIEHVGILYLREQ